jgi:TonB family protein
MSSQEGLQRPDQEGRSRSRRYAALVAAAVLASSAAWADEGEPVRFHDAAKLYEAKKYPEAFALFEVLAKEWDYRAQILLGSALVHGSVIPRDIPRGFAWLRIAADESVASPASRARAAEYLLRYEKVLSGADLIRADAIAGELRAERKRQLSLRVDSAYARLLQPGPGADEVKEGCALDTALTGCRKARPDVSDKVAACQLPAEHWPGASDDRESWHIEAPKYPDRARRHAWEGWVVVAVHVDGSGWICRATVANGSGFQELDSAALDAVRRWRLAPRVVDGQPTSYLFDVNALFRLTGYVIKSW